MTDGDIHSTLTWHDDHTAEGRIFLPVFDREVPLEIITAETIRDVTPAMQAALADLLAIGSGEFPRVVQMVHDHCKSCCANSFYNIVPEGEDVTQVNHRLFGLNPDGSAPPDWFQTDWLRCVYVIEDFDDRPPDAWLDFRVAWDDHGVHLRPRDGRFIEFNP